LVDAGHIALSSVYGLDVLVSWNKADIVKLRVKQGVNAVNIAHGYRPLEIVDPTML